MGLDPVFAQVAGGKGIFCVIVPQDPRNSTLYFTGPMNKRTGGTIGGCASPRHFPYRACLWQEFSSSIQTFRPDIPKGDPSGSINE
jgi:hypothetical protein